MKPILISFCWACAASESAHRAATIQRMGTPPLRRSLPKIAAMPFATLNGIRVQYVVQGKGPHLLMFAPGGFRSVISRWTAQGGKREWKEMDGLAALSRHFTCIAYDRRESGLSGGRVEPLTWDLYVQEAKGLLDLAGASEAHVLGSCMGAALALAFAVRHPRAC